jgi:hypothetical protein
MASNRPLVSNTLTEHYQELFEPAAHEVSTGSGSDRVSTRSARQYIPRERA